MDAVLIVLQLMLNILVVGRSENILTEILRDFNEEYRIELNVAIDLGGNQSSEFVAVIAKLEQPKLLISDGSIEDRQLYKTFNMQVLTIARMDERNLNATVALLEQLLWKRHSTTIIIWFETFTEATFELENLFRKCWRNGYTSILVWWQSRLYTFKPYPEIQVIPLTHFSQFKDDKSSLEDFHQHQISILLVDMPPRCFSYHNSQGRLVRTGYYYKLIENFVSHYNGSLQCDFLDIWSIKIDQDFINKVLVEDGYSFIATYLLWDDTYASSDAISNDNSYLIVPSSQEIQQGLYPLISFTGSMWLMVSLVLLAIVVLIYFMSLRNNHKRSLPRSLLQSLKVILFMAADDFQRRTFFNYLLHLLFLLTGLFITNLYSCNLCSLYSSRVYEPEIMTLKDVARTNLPIIAHTAEFNYYRNLKNLPEVIYERLTSGNNSDLYVNRQKLNMIYIFIGMEEAAQFVLYQQTYMRRPIAKYISEPLYTLPTFIPLPHRSPLIERFNLYLGRMKSSGIFNKFVAESQLDGIMSGNIQFFRDPEFTHSLSVHYFKYIFAIWFVGLLCASITFLCEILCQKSINVPTDDEGNI